MRRYSILALVLIFCMTALTGAYGFENKQIWRYKADLGLTGGIALSTNTVFAGDASGKFYAIQKSNGRLIWTYSGTNTITGTPVLIGNEQVIFAQANGVLTCLNENTGDEIWVNEPETERDTVVSGAVYGEGKIFISRSDGRLCAYDVTDGHLLWEYQSKLQDLRNEPAYDNGLVFLGEQNGLMSMINAKTGERVNGGGSGGPINTPIVNNGNVYYSSWSGSVYAVKIKDVIPLWEMKIQEPVTTSPSFGDNKLFVGTSNGKIIALAAGNGDVTWTYDTEGANVNKAPLFGDGLVFCGASEGNIYAVNANTGEVKYSLKTEHGLDVEPAYENGILYYSADGFVYAVK